MVVALHLSLSYSHASCNVHSRTQSLSRSFPIILLVLGFFEPSLFVGYPSRVYRMIISSLDPKTTGRQDAGGQEMRPRLITLESKRGGVASGGARETSCSIGRLEQRRRGLTCSFTRSFPDLAHQPSDRHRPHYTPTAPDDDIPTQAVGKVKNSLRRAHFPFGTFPVVRSLFPDSRYLLASRAGRISKSSCSAKNEHGTRGRLAVWFRLG